MTAESVFEAGTVGFFGGPLNQTMFFSLTANAAAPHRRMGASPAVRCRGLLAAVTHLTELRPISEIMLVYFDSTVLQRGRTKRGPINSKGLRRITVAVIKIARLLDLKDEG